VAFLKMKILIVEDELKTAELLRKGLTENGFSVDTAIDGEQGLHLATTCKYDLIVLDVMLPIRDGWSVVSALRETGNSTLTLFLTAKDTLEDRIRGLDLGADAYLVKPFAFSELLALVRTLLRRSQSGVQNFRLADLEIDFLHQKVHRGDKRLDLTPKEFTLLALFARHAGETLSRSFIANQIWEVNYDSETNVVDVHIGRLRAKLEVSNAPKLLHTVRGAGYTLRDDSNGDGDPVE
jgi:two-component system, OmpR family, copper resistance phosphate regulon response regulator CusR